MKLLSITVPCYNSEEYMERCIESLLTGGERVEIIIVNDGSKDTTGAIADAYAAKYPTIVRVIHQENQGHGGGINNGLKAASGKYFKVVDSDDAVNLEAYTRYLDALEKTDADMVVTNYVYTHDDSSLDKAIKYNNVFPDGKLVGWDKTHRFGPTQYLTIHSVTYKREKMLESGLNLPLHLFYEDNLMVFTVLPYIESILYLNADLYLYTIGRDGQSVQESIIMKRYRHQIEASKRLFIAHHLGDIKNKKLRRYMYHELVMLLLIASVFGRLNKTAVAEEDVQNMWKECAEFDKKYAHRIKRSSLAAWVNMRGKFGRDIGIALYRFAHKVVNFN